MSARDRERPASRSASEVPTFGVRRREAGRWRRWRTRFLSSRAARGARRRWRGYRSMRLPQSGGCQCGAVRYEVSGPPRIVYACHCTECQRQSGSAFAMAAVIPGESFRITKASRDVRSADQSGEDDGGAGSARSADAAVSHAGAAYANRNFKLGHWMTRLARCPRRILDAERATVGGHSGRCDPV